MTESIQGKRNGSTVFHVIAITIVAIWGTTFISTKTLLSAGLRPDEIFIIRFSMAYVAMAVIQLCGRKSFNLLCSDWKDEAKMAFCGITGGSLYFWSENSALEYTLASNVSFIVCTAPLLTALLYSAVKRERLARNTLLGSLLSLTGLAMIAFSGGEGIKLDLRGDLLAIVAALTWAFYTIEAAGLMGKYPSTMLTRKVFFYGIITIIPVVLGKGWDCPMESILQTKVVLNLVFLGLVASLGCYAVWNVVIRKLGEISSSNYIYLNPLFTLVGAILILGERLAPVAAVGFVLTLAGVWIAGRVKKKKDERS